MNHFDVIVIGAGSVGVPTAMALAEGKTAVLTIDNLASPGQGQNKKAIGGIRATHSDKGKITTCLRSIEIFSTWEAMHGDDIGWIQNGYSFPAYTDEDAKKLKDLMKIQKSFDLDIDWLSAQEYQKIVPGINMDGLRGSTYSPKTAVRLRCGPSMRFALKAWNTGPSTGSGKKSQKFKSWAAMRSRSSRTRMCTPPQK
jgi:sarcosine oxidase, subunit beta